MTTLTITLPDSLAKWLNRQIGSGRYASAGDYIQDLILRDRHIAEFVSCNDRKLGGFGEEAMTEQDVREMIEAARMLPLLRIPANEE